MDSNDEQPWNIVDIVITDLVLNSGMDFNDEQLQNIDPIALTFDVSNNGTDVRFVHLKNIQYADMGGRSLVKSSSITI